MMRLLVLLALCGAAARVPLAAVAQAGPELHAAPTPEVRAMMDKARADAKAAAYGALTPAHAAAVTAVVAQVVAGTLDRRAAGGRIDALLTPDEQTAVLAAAEKSRGAMRAAMTAAGGPPPGPGGPPPPHRGHIGPPSAGRYLLMVSLSRQQRRSLMPRARSTAAP